MNKDEARNEYQIALVDLVNALTEWRDAGADVLQVVSAIQKFIHAINANERIAQR